MFRKHEHAPVKFTRHMETLYGLCEKMDKDPSMTPMSTPRQRKETLVNAFLKDCCLVYELRGGEYTESFAETGKIMKDHFDHERESSSSSSSSDSTESSKSSNGSTNNRDSSNSERKKKIAKSNKRKNKRYEYSKKRGKTSKKTPKQAKPTKK